MHDVVSHVENCLIAVEEMRSRTLRYHDRGVGRVTRVLCAALGLVPAPNDGDDRLVRTVLRP